MSPSSSLLLGHSALTSTSIVCGAHDVNNLLVTWYYYENNVTSTRWNSSSSSSYQRAPIPGRLVRTKRRKNGNGNETSSTATAALDVAVAASRDIDGVFTTATPIQIQQQQVELSPQEKRIAQRKAAIERRRLFLEKGIVPPLVATEHGQPATGDAAPANVNVVDHQGSLGLDAAKHSSRKAPITIIREENTHEDQGSAIIEVETMTMMDDIAEDATRTTSTRPKHRAYRSSSRPPPVHSLGKSTLSAADSHRRRMRQIREEKQQRQQQQRGDELQQVQDNMGYQSSQGGAQARIQQLTRHEGGSSTSSSSQTSNNTHAFEIGGSYVASQSATARFRQGRLQQRQQGRMMENNEQTTSEYYGHGGGRGRLKTNPSVVSIPLSESTSSIEGTTECGSNGNDNDNPTKHAIGSSSSVGDKANNFDQRYQKLQGENMQKKKGWSLFGWLSGN